MFYIAALGTTAAWAVASKDRTEPVSRNLRQRISGDSSKLGQVAESLLGVQNDINRVEKEVMGKVFDLQTVRTFFATHQALETERDQLDAKNAELQQTITQVSNHAVAQQQEFTTKEQQLQHHLALQTAGMSDLQVHVQTLQKELDHRKMVEQDKAALQHLNQVLRDQLTATTSQAELQQKQLLDAQKNIQILNADIQRLKEELKSQHDYGVMCHSKMAQMEQLLAAEQQHESANDAATRAAAKQADAAAVAAQQRLLSEKQLLEHQLVNQQTMLQSQAAKIEALARRLTASNDALTATKQQAQQEVQQLKFQEGAVKTQLRTCDDSLMQNVQARNLVEKQLHACHEQLLGNKEAILESKLGQCEDIYKQTSTAFNAAQVKLAKAIAERDQALNDRKAAEESSKVNQKAAQEAMKTAQERVVEKTKESAAAQEQAQQAIMAAEASLSKKCMVVWKKRNKEVRKELKQCKVTEDDLVMAKAQATTLEESLKACTQSQ